jgi:hypothetical protein
MTFSIMTFSKMTHSRMTFSIQQNDIQQNDIHQNDTQQNEIQYNEIQQNGNLQNDTQQNDIQHNEIQHNATMMTSYKMTINIASLLSIASQSMTVLSRTQIVTIAKTHFDEMLSVIMVIVVRMNEEAPCSLCLILVTSVATRANPIKLF